MTATEIWEQIKANLPNVITNTPYSAAVVLVVGIAVGFCLA